MTSETKKGAPRTGLYFRLETKDIEARFAALRQAFMVINRSSYEKNMHVLEIILSDKTERDYEGAALLKDVGQAAGIVVLIRNDIDLARRIEADGVMLDNFDDLKTAKAAFEDEQIVGLRCAGDKDKAKQALDAGADFISFGSEKFLPEPHLAAWWSSLTDNPALIEGGVDNDNARDYVETGAGFLDASSYVFDHPKGAMQGAVNMLYAIDLAGGSGQKLN